MTHYRVTVFHVFTLKVLNFVSTAHVVGGFPTNIIGVMILTSVRSNCGYYQCVQF